MVSYSGSSYTNELFDLSGVILTSQSSSSIDIDESDTRHLQKTGGSISSNLIINGSLDVKKNITLPEIGDVEDTIQEKQDTINDGDLSIAKTNGLQAALNGKQPTKEDEDITISKTNGLLHVEALNTKQPTINEGDLTIANTDGLLEALNAKQPTIEDGDLIIAKKSGLQTALDTKQDEID